MLASLALLVIALAARPPQDHPRPPPQPAAHTIAAPRASADSGAAIGTAHPLAGVMAAPNGRWFVVCQAREDTDDNGRLEVTRDFHSWYGDQLVPYLVLGAGPGAAIDYPAAHSKDGAWLAVVRGGGLELVDATTFRRTALPAELVNDWHWTRDKNARFASIAANGTRMTYLRRDPASRQQVIVIRDLPSGRERTVAVAGLLWRATAEPDGRWASVLVMRADTDHDGKVEWPGGVADRSLNECDTDIVHHRNPSGDEPTELWLDLATGELVDDPTVLGPAGDHLVRRRADGALTLGGVELVEPACQAQVVTTMSDPLRVGFTCAARARKVGPGDDLRAPLELIGAGFRTVTRYLAHRDAGDSVSDHRRFLPLDDRTAYLDVVDGSEVHQPGTYEDAEDDSVLVRLDRGWAVFELATRKLTILAGATGARSYKFDSVAPGLVRIGDSLYHLPTATRAGDQDDDIVLVNPAGRVVVARRETTPSAGAAPGPLRWAR